jgi:hypothetical protein
LGSKGIEIAVATVNMRDLSGKLQMVYVIQREVTHLGTNKVNKRFFLIITNGVSGSKKKINMSDSP